VGCFAGACFGFSCFSKCSCIGVEFCVCVFSFFFPGIGVRETAAVWVLHSHDLEEDLSALV
jgi:hypothetical protein